jgi:hypothetical protein
MPLYENFNFWSKLALIFLSEKSVYQHESSQRRLTTTIYLMLMLSLGPRMITKNDWMHGLSVVE